MIAVMYDCCMHTVVHILPKQKVQLVYISLLAILDDNKNLQTTLNICYGLIKLCKYMRQYQKLSKFLFGVFTHNYF